MASFFIVYLNAKPNHSKDSIKKKMDLALDWYKIDDKTWILYSSSDEEKLYGRLSPLAKEEGNIFICELNVSKRQGWMAKSFWKWLKKDR